MYSLPLVKPKPAGSDNEISLSYFTPPKMGKSMVQVIKQEINDDNLETVPKSGSKKVQTFKKGEISYTKKSDTVKRKSNENDQRDALSSPR